MPMVPDQDRWIKHLLFGLLLRVYDVLPFDTVSHIVTALNDLVHHVQEELP